MRNFQVPEHIVKFSNLDWCTLNKYENVILLADFNASTEDSFMEIFCENYDLRSLVKEPTCFKNPEIPGFIDLILTNKPGSFLRRSVIETGLSDYHK